MLSLVILIVLLIGTYNAYKNGIILALIQTIGYTISAILALKYYKAFSQFLYLIIPYPSPFSPAENPYAYYDMDMIFTLDQSYYQLVSFLILIIIGIIVTYFVSRLLSSFAEELYVPEPFDSIGGGLLAFFQHYIAIFFILFTLSTIPYDFIQNRLANSWLADSMIVSSPVISEFTYQDFIQEVYEEEIKKLPVMELEDLKEIDQTVEE